MQERLARGEVALCMATRLARTAEIAMIADSCGFDAFFIDMEHCPISLDAAAQICVAALPVGVTPLVRIAGHRFEDATACSIWVRSVSSARCQHAGGSRILCARLPLSATG